MEEEDQARHPVYFTLLTTMHNATALRHYQWSEQIITSGDNTYHVTASGAIDVPVAGSCKSVCGWTFLFLGEILTPDFMEAESIEVTDGASALEKSGFLRVGLGDSEKLDLSGGDVSTPLPCILVASDFCKVRKARRSFKNCCGSSIVSLPSSLSPSSNAFLPVAINRVRRRSPTS